MKEALNTKSVKSINPCKSVIQTKAHGGKMAVESEEENNGTEFTITLPRQS